MHAYICIHDSVSISVSVNVNVRVDMFICSYAHMFIRSYVHDGQISLTVILLDRCCLLDERLTVGSEDLSPECSR